MDNSPKRRKSKDNPYEINKDSQTDTYIVKFKDGNKRIHIIEINSTIYDVFNESELIDLSQLNEYDRHIEHLSLDDNSIYYRASNKQQTIEEMIEKKLQSEELYKAISKLSDIQKRRIKMYYFENMTLQEIAKIEGCSIMSVKESIDSGINKLRKNLKN